MNAIEELPQFILPAIIDSDLNLAHLQTELARIDVRIQRDVVRWQRAGQDPEDEYRGLHISNADAGNFLKRPLGNSWGETIALTDAEVAHFVHAEQQALAQVRQIMQLASTRGESLRLVKLAQDFALTPFDVDVLLICLAPTLDLRYEWLYSYLQDDISRKRPSVNLILNLLCLPGPERFSHRVHFADDAPLLRQHLLHLQPSSAAADLPLLSRSLMIDLTVAEWLLGRYCPHGLLAGHTALLQPQVNDSERLLAGDIASLLAHTGAGSPVATPIWVFDGVDKRAQAAAARVLATTINRPLLAVNLAGLIEQDVPPLQAVHLALLDARLANAIPYLSGWDSCLVQGTPSPPLLAALCTHPTLVVVAGQRRWQPREMERARDFYWQTFPAPAYAQREALWRHFLEQSGTGAGLDLTTLVSQFALTTEQIRDAVYTAQDRAAQQGRVVQIDDLFGAARIHSNLSLDTLARKISSRFAWQDIVLPDDQLAILHELVAMVRQRPFVLETWGVGRKLAASAGITVLFAGPPGTGKTMAAEVIAGELGLDLYKIDLSGVVSKYIGETEKNLERIFHEAASSNTILFFDEADALFGKRSEVKDAHDRYANIEVSYLLQRMEAYDGITILATNLWTNLDEAFARRLHFVVDFPFPEEVDRLRIWQALFPPQVPRAPDLDLGLMARRFKLAGGNIRNILVTATYLAAADGHSVTMAHLLHGTRRELQKMGRMVSEAELRV